MYIGIDIGGTNIRIASSETLDFSSFADVTKVLISNNYSTDFQKIITAIHELSGGQRIDAIGCGFPGVLSEDKLIILHAPNLSNWINKSFPVDLEREFSCQVIIENDDTISALGEAKYGKGKHRNFVYLTWGTGFGGADVKQKEGKISVRQFEAGHHIVSWEDGRLCGCGQRGCAEAYIGGGNIEKYYQKRITDLNDSEWGEIITYFANVLAFNYTQLIIIGGGVAIHNREKLKLIEEKMQGRLKIYPMPEVFITELGDDLGLYGSFALLG